MDTSEAGRQPVDGRFELIGPLGAGGMGTVWRARDIALHRDVALKEVRPPDPATAAAQPGLVVQLRERAVREARALARLTHPNVVTIHHIVEPAPGGEGHPWIVMELVKGGSLHDRLESGPMPVADVLRIGLDVLSALRAAHAEGVLHRDVKPANVLLRPEGSAVLTDFGIAAVHGSTALTSTGALIGSPEYIAPERLRGSEGLAASDLWSLGMTLYVAAEGVHPLRRATTMATMVATLEDSIPAPTRSGPLGPVLERLLVRDPAARPDAEQLGQLLRNASSALQGTPPAPAPVPASVPSPGFGPYGPPPTAVNPPTAPFGPPGGNPYAMTAPVPAARTPRRRPVLLAALVAVLLAGGATLAVRLLADGDDGARDDAKGGPAASRSADPSAGASPAGATPSTGTPSASTPAGRTDSRPAVANRGDLLTPDGARAGLEALKQGTGTTTFVRLVVYPEYMLADVPTAPGAKTYDNWQYRDGVARRLAPGGTMAANARPMDMSAVKWDALPSLLDESRERLGVAVPSQRYLILDVWSDDTPAVRPYISDPYGQGGYVLAGVDGKIKKVVRS
ncbi:serine/threonine-protein kinase [Streptomyces sp. NPDC102278]|uniref:serine/threonine-protein kinase n=1 Tax=Streptomyces sp. NPDC102278 TaxID=3366152 RepID=UPI0037F1C53C